MKIKYFLDCEFIEDGRTIDLVSIGVVCEDGREFYAEVDKIDWSKANPWVLAKVKPHMKGQSWFSPDSAGPTLTWGLLSRPQIAAELRDFTSGVKGRPEFWSYFSAYDWVAVCQLFGTMTDLPGEWPMFCMDLKQYAVTLGNPRLPIQNSTEHNALDDARWHHDIYKSLRRYHLSRLADDKTVEAVEE